MKQIIQNFRVAVALLGLCSCSHFAQIDRELLNHPSMDLGAYEAKKNQAPLSQLSGVGAGGASAGCSVCAH